MRKKRRLPQNTKPAPFGPRLSGPKEVVAILKEIMESDGGHSYTKIVADMGCHK